MANLVGVLESAQRLVLPRVNVLSSPVITALEEAMAGMQRFNSHLAVHSFVGHLNEMMADLERKSTRLEKMLTEMKWPPPSLLPAPLADEITLAYAKGTLSATEVEELFVVFYTPERLKEMVETWDAKAEFQSRTKIAKAAIWAHNHEKFELSIPALLPQIEGLLGELFGHKGRFNGQHFLKYLKAVFGRDSRFDQIAVSFFMKVLLENFEWGDPMPAFSRHAILHGGDLNYGTAANSLRLILVFDLVLASAKFVSTKQGRKYHLASCSVLRDKGEPRAFSTRREAEHAGLSACTRCVGATLTRSKSQANQPRQAQHSK
jgi:hypothetical protein